MTNVPLSEVLKYVCMGVSGRRTIEDYAVFLHAGCVDILWGVAYYPVRPDVEVPDGLPEKLRQADAGDWGPGVAVLRELSLVKTSNCPGTGPKLRAVLAEAGVFEEPDAPAEVDWAVLPPREQMFLKLRHVVLPRLDFHGMDIEVAAAYLANEIRKADPFGTGVNIIVDRAAFVRAATEERRVKAQYDADRAAAREPLPVDASGKPLGDWVPPVPRVHPFRAELNLCFADISGADALRYVCEAVQSHWRVEDDGHVTIGREPADTEMGTHVYLLSPRQIRNRLARHTPPVAADPAAAVTVSEDDIRTIFAGVGVTFGEGSGVSWDDKSRLLRVTNTAPEFCHRIAPLAEVLTPSYVHVRLPAGKP
ncbi:MAG: hypothetical protein A3K19_15605 [Lentisphaerae bacterium RIFOXYB12_FULL_65_16]|nr:MAG: hypothetical protein A3K18_11620 [Lentisphaerae bacterium RIFOXYA12_64_32]OGV88527.1 MAG: hypothetical protein A3K19_15605 [Lentisphaerae bacterium RIFOXYB12_FULL_65_16]